MVYAAFFNLWYALTESYMNTIPKISRNTPTMVASRFPIIANPVAFIAVMYVVYVIIDNALKHIASMNIAGIDVKYAGFFILTR